jgi:hypothetical protein
MKYHNKKTVIDGITFDSKKEAQYYAELKLLQRAGEITAFERQVRYELQPGFTYQGQKVRPIHYIADFVVTYNNGQQEVVDCKGMRTKDYILKSKMFRFKFPMLKFVEV